LQGKVRVCVYVPTSGSVDDARQIMRQFFFNAKVTSSTKRRWSSGDSDKFEIREVAVVESLTFVPASVLGIVITELTDRLLEKMPEVGVEIQLGMQVFKRPGH
jgi:hypothetical protein